MLGVKANAKEQKKRVILFGGVAVTVADAVINVSDKDSYDPELKRRSRSCTRNECK